MSTKRITVGVTDSTANNLTNRDSLEVTLPLQRTLLPPQMLQTAQYLLLQLVRPLIFSLLRFQMKMKGLTLLL